MTDAASPVGTPPTVRASNQGGMERRDPVPVGRYWIYIDESETERWQAWVSASGGKVKVIVTEALQTVSKWIPAIFVTRWDLDIIQSVVGYWILFDVLSPVKWVGFGYPTTVIDPTINSSTDTSTAPDPEPEWNPLGALLGDAKWLLLIGGALYIASQASSLAKTFGPARSARSAR